MLWLPLVPHSLDDSSSPFDRNVRAKMIDCTDLTAMAQREQRVVLGGWRLCRKFFDYPGCHGRGHLPCDRCFSL